MEKTLKPIMPDLSKIKRLKPEEKNRVKETIDLIPIYHIPGMILGEYETKGIETKFMVLKSLRWIARIMKWSKYVPFVIPANIKAVIIPIGQMLYKSTDDYLDRAGQ